MCEAVRDDGSVTGRDLFESAPMAGVRFVAYRILDVRWEPVSFDAMSAFEALSHIADQEYFFACPAPDRNIEIDSVVPVGGQGILRRINSRKLNMLFGPFRPAIERAKERVMLGQTLLAWGTKA